MRITPVDDRSSDLNDYLVIRDTVASGDTFGAILDANGVTQNIIYEIATSYKDSFDRFRTCHR